MESFVNSNSRISKIWLRRTIAIVALAMLLVAGMSLLRPVTAVAQFDNTVVTANVQQDSELASMSSFLKRHRIGPWKIVSAVFMLILALLCIPLYFYFVERGRYEGAKRLIQAVEGARDGVWDWDVRGDKVAFTRRTFTLLGVSPDDQNIEKPLDLFLSSADESCSQRVSKQFQNWLSCRKSARITTDFRVADDGVEPVWVRIRGFIVCENEEVIRMSGSVMDISGEKLQSAHLEHQVMHDVLTGLPNRSLMNDRLDKQLASARRSMEPFAVLMIDLNRFKDINDSLGHAVGDELLKTVGGRLSDSVREQDTVARLGGDEFAVLLPNTPVNGAETLARQLSESLSRQPIMLHEHSFIIEASIGVALFPDHGDSAESLLQRADMAMYTAKRGKLDFTFYSAAENAGALGRIELENDLREAIEKDGLELHYQPKVDILTKKVIGAEALIRWTHPEYGSIQAGQVAELAERSGLIHKFSAWVIRRASLQSSAWGDINMPLKIAVNLSVWNIQNPHIIEVVKRGLEESRVPPDMIEFEITESAMIVDPIKAHKTLHELSDLGIDFSVDDFGTGFSSLSYLKRLPVQSVKIDKSFVRDMVTDAADRSIVQSIVDMAHNLGLLVVAEGVEDYAMLDLLTEMGCDQAQGYLFSPALPPDEFERWVERGIWDGLRDSEPDRSNEEVSLSLSEAS